MASIEFDDKQFMAFLKEYTPIECGCCGEVFGFQHKTTGVFICPKGCHGTHQRNSEVNRNGEASPPAHSPTPPPLKKTSVVPSVAAAVSPPLLSSQTNAVHNQQKVHLVKEERSIEEQSESHPIKEVTTSNDVDLNPKPRQEQTQQSHPIKKTVTLDSVDSTVKSQPGLAKPAVAVVPSTSMNGMTPSPKTSGQPEAKFPSKNTVPDTGGKRNLWSQCRYSPNLDSNVNIKVKSPWSPIRYFIVADEDQDALINIQEKVKEHVLKGKRLDQTPIVNEMVIGKYKEEYYRGRVTEVEGETCTLFFVDYGDIIFCKFRDLFAVDAELMQYPIYGMVIELEKVAIPSNFRLPDEIQKMLTEILTLDLVIGRRPQLGEAEYFEARLRPSTGSFSINTKVRDAVVAAKVNNL